MGKILVTGANGYIGKYVVLEMQKQNIDFIAIDFMNNNIDANVPFIQCNIFEEKALSKKIGQPDVLLHLAWKDGFIHNSNSHMSELSAHYTFITDMIEAGVKHICVMGSMHEVGYHEGEIDEHTSTNPLSQYGIAKNALRQSLELYCKGKGVTFQWIRGFYIYGDDLQGNSIFSKLQQAHLERKTTFPFTTGKNKYDFISIYDLAKQITAVVTQTEVDGIINCCSGNPISLAEQVEWYIKKNNLSIELEYGVFPDRQYDSPAIWGNSEKILTILNEK